MSTPVPRALLFVDLVDSTAFVERLGDTRAADVFAQFDRLARASFAEHGGREIDRTDGFLVLFERPAPAVTTAFDLHAAAASLGLSARAAVTFGEVVLRENSVDDVRRGAKPLEVDGLPKPVGARLLSLALPRQTLLTSVAVELVKRAHQGGDLLAETRFLDHGPYRLKGVSEPLHVHEAGLPGRAPLRFPPGAAKGAPVRRRGRVLGVLALALVAGTAVYVTRPVGPPPIPTFHERRIVSLPADREVTSLTLKPDGTALLYIEHGQVQRMALPDGEPLPLGVDLGGPAASMDLIPPGEDLLVVVRSDHAMDRTDSPVVRVSAAGSVTTLPWMAQRVSVSGDGRRALLDKEDGSWVGDLATGQSARLGPRGVADWSPDSAEVAVVSLGMVGEDLLRIMADGSKTTRLLQGAPIFDRYQVRPVWLEPDTLWIPFHRTVGDNRSGGIERLRLDPDTGLVVGREVILQWPDEKVAGLDVALDRGGDLWAAVRTTTQDEVFVVDVGPDGLPIGEPKPVTQHRRSDRPTDWLPDGRVVFTSDRSGVFDVFAQRPGEVTAARLAGGPALQTWGRVTSTGALLCWEIVPVATPSEVQRARVLRYDAEGGPPRTLLEVDIESTLRLTGRPPPGTAWMSCARDVETCVLARVEGDRYVARTLDPATGVLGDPLHRQPLPMTPTSELSPDGTRVAMIGEKTKIVLVSVADQSVEEIPLEGYSDLHYIAWRPDGESLYVTGWHVSDDGVFHCSVVLVDLRTATTRVVRSSESWKGQVTLSWDGRRLAWLEWDGSNDVFLYERTPPS